MKRTVPPRLPVLRLQTGGALADAYTPSTRLADVLSAFMECYQDAISSHDFARQAALLPFFHRCALVSRGLEC